MLCWCKTEKPLGLFEQSNASNEVPQTPKGGCETHCVQKNIALLRRAIFFGLAERKGFEPLNGY